MGFLAHKIGFTIKTTSLAISSNRDLTKKKNHIETIKIKNKIIRNRIVNEKVLFKSNILVAMVDPCSR